MFRFGVCIYIFYRILKDADYQSEFLFSTLKITSSTQLVTFRFSYFFFAIVAAYCNTLCIGRQSIWFSSSCFAIEFTILQSSTKFIISYIKIFRHTDTIWDQYIISNVSYMFVILKCANACMCFLDFWKDCVFAKN